MGALSQVLLLEPHPCLNHLVFFTHRAAVDAHEGQVGAGARLGGDASDGAGIGHAQHDLLEELL